MCELAAAAPRCHVTLFQTGAPQPQGSCRVSVERMQLAAAAAAAAGGPRARAVAQAEAALRDAVTIGRPDWDAILAAAAASVQPPARGSEVAVLACGPEGLVAGAAAAARRARVHLHTETFLL